MHIAETKDQDKKQTQRMFSVQMSNLLHRHVERVYVRQCCAQVGSSTVATLNTKHETRVDSRESDSFWECSSNAQDSKMGSLLMVIGQSQLI